MRKTSALAVILAVALASGTAAAQAVDPGGIGEFFTATPLSAEDAIRNGVVAFVPFDIFTLVYAAPGGMEAYEFSVQMPPGALVTAGRLLPAGATDFGVGDDNWIVGTGGICQGATGWFTLVKYGGTLFLAAPGNDVPFCLAGATPSSFANGWPGYLVCQAPGVLRNFGLAYAGCAFINCTAYFRCHPLPNAESTFGALKASY